jgi:hypothetical protein
VTGAIRIGALRADSEWKIVAGAMVSSGGRMARSARVAPAGPHLHRVGGEMLEK